MQCLAVCCSVLRAPNRDRQSQRSTEQENKHKQTDTHADQHEPQQHIPLVSRGGESGGGRGGGGTKHTHIYTCRGLGSGRLGSWYGFFRSWCSFFGSRRCSLRSSGVGSWRGIGGRRGILSGRRCGLGSGCCCLVCLALLNSCCLGRCVCYGGVATISGLLKSIGLFCRI